MFHNLFKHTKHISNYYANNPHKAHEHTQHAVRIGSLAWTQRHTVAKHTTKFLQKAASKSFSLFRS
jgi:hypothetical protein